MKLKDNLINDTATFEVEPGMIIRTDMDNLLMVVQAGADMGEPDRFAYLYLEKGRLLCESTVFGDTILTHNDGDEISEGSRLFPDNTPIGGEITIERIYDPSHVNLTLEDA